MTTEKTPLVKKIFVPIMASKCTRCAHLVEDGTKVFDCTVESGNNMCPAGKYQIGVGIDPEELRSYAVRYVRYTQQGSLRNMRILLNKLSKLSEANQEQVFDIVSYLNTTDVPYAEPAPVVVTNFGSIDNALIEHTHTAQSDSSESDAEDTTNVLDFTAVNAEEFVDDVSPKAVKDDTDLNLETWTSVAK